MRRFLLKHTLRLTLLAAAGGIAPLRAQQLNPEEYVYPLQQVQRLYSANFGEMRPDHFHSGIDIKTDGVTGKPVVAAADGYVSRISVSPTGYGLALYVAHPNGTTSVYGHLERFRDDIAEYVRGERIRRRSHRVDLYCLPDRFPVRRGEQIARSGNSGTSFGPHLHFEIRNSRTQRTHNLIAAGVIRPDDDIPPYIVRLHYTAVDSLRGTAVESPMRSCDVRRIDARTYVLTDTLPLPVDRQGYFVVETTDRKNGVSNTFGVYRVRLTVDDQPRFEYRMDGFTFDQSRYCNSASCYPLQSGSRNEAIRLARQAGCRGDFHPIVHDGGLVSAAPGERRRVRIEAQDDCGNLSQLTFEIVGKADSAAFRAPADTLSPVVDRTRDFRTTIDDITVEIPAGALYESILFRGGRTETPLPNDSGLCILSPVYRILSDSIPLHKAAKFTLRTEVDPALRPHTAIATLSRKGKIVRLGGEYRDGAIVAATRTLGTLFAVADTVAPVVKPLFAEAGSLAGAAEIAFRVADDFSGIASYTAEIDGEWVILDYEPLQNRLVHRFADSSLPHGRHTIRLEVADGCNNTARYEGTFRR